MDEYYRMAEAGILTEEDRVELIEGEIIAMPPIGSGHSGPVNRGGARLGARLTGNALVIVQNPVRLSSGSEPVPDIAVVRPRDDYYEQGHPTPEDVCIIIEVSDTTLQYDRTVKLLMYARAGIKEYRVVDVKVRRILVHRDPFDGGYRTVTELRQGDSIETLLPPGVSIAADDILG